MMLLPIDLSAVRFVAAGDPEPVVHYDSGRPKIDAATGAPLYQVRLVAMGPAGAEVIPVKVPGQPIGLVNGSPVKVTGLTANPWALKDKAGISYRAAAIEPATTSSTGGSGGRGQAA